MLRWPNGGFHHELYEAVRQFVTHKRKGPLRLCKYPVCIIAQGGPSDVQRCDGGHGSGDAGEDGLRWSTRGGGPNGRSPAVFAENHAAFRS